METENKNGNRRASGATGEIKRRSADIGRSADPVREEEYHIDATRRGVREDPTDRTADLEMTDPATRTMIYGKPGRVEMTGSYDKPEEKRRQELSNVTLQMTQIPILDLEDEQEDDDRPYSPDSLGKSRESRPVPPAAAAELESEEEHHHHHHHSGDGEHHHHHSGDGEHHHHHSESGEHHRHSSDSGQKRRLSGSFEDMKSAASDAERRKAANARKRKAAAAAAAAAMQEKKSRSAKPAEDKEPARTADSVRAAAPARESTKPRADKPAQADAKPAKKKKEKPAEIKQLKPLFRFANIAYPALVFAVTAVAFMALPRPETSETEQRNLAAFPEFSVETFLNGEYTNGITEYFNDRIPFRDDLKRLAAQVKNMFGVSYGDVEISGPLVRITEEEDTEPEPVIVTETQAVTAAPVSEVTTAGTTAAEVTSGGTAADTAAPPEVTTAETTAQTTKSTVETTKNMNEIADGVITNGQVVTKLSDGHWWGISLFGGGKGTNYAKSLNRFKEQLGDSVNVYSMVVPTAGEYYLPDTYSDYSASHQKSIDSIDSQLVNVISVPGSLALWEHVNEPIYTRTDHHWQPLGAYYAAKCFVETAGGLPFTDISTMTRVDIDGYMGTMYGFTQSANLQNDPETFTYYKPDRSTYKVYYYDTAYKLMWDTFDFFIPMPVSGAYATFMASDDKIVRIKTTAGTGRKLVVFKDSYGNAEIPFYFGSFDEIWVCDIRYFDLNAVEFVKFTGATDLLFTMCTFSAVGTNADHIDVIMNNPITDIKETAN